MITEKTETIARILFSRCMESEHRPGKIRFTKYLYLLDYCSFRLGQKQATEIEWRFFHYGPWSLDAAHAMDAVQRDYPRIVWGEYEDDFDRDGDWMPDFEPIGARLSLEMESVVGRIIVAFKSRDVSDVVEYCYLHTEPMLNADRGDVLNFGTIPPKLGMPKFLQNKIPREMPTLSDKDKSIIEDYKRKVQNRLKAARYALGAMDTEGYRTAMAMLASEKCGELPDLRKMPVRLTDAAAKSLQETVDDRE